LLYGFYYNVEEWKKDKLCKTRWNHMYKYSLMAGTMLSSLDSREISLFVYSGDSSCVDVPFFIYL
jgi:hypothetical protein